MELAELEALTSRTAAWPHDVPAAELIAAFFGSLTEAARQEQERVSLPYVCDTNARRNRRDTYLNSRTRTHWEARALCHLARCKDIAVTLSTEALYSAVAMQHLLELDVADLSLPSESRCSDDSFICGVNNQFLLDAPRCRYTVDSEVFHLAAKGNAARSNSGDLADAFASRLTRAIQRVTPPLLLERVTTMMSQSGLAALERASLCDLAVSGGPQKVEYSLDKDPANPDSVLLTMQVKKTGFSEFLINSSSEERPCDPCSSISKKATVSLNVSGDVDVVDFIEDIDVRQDGIRLPVESLRLPLPRASVPQKPVYQESSPLWQCVNSARECVMWACCIRRKRRPMRPSEARDVIPGPGLSRSRGRSRGEIE
eukprot:TRINITY_DN73463_c0_g1_i1.p1 TRINITY_DN73463_c0_g1~~TRINITY_DN73463_c0_g1_i1.p1  ORF type:complete len:384 (-),score=37.59 TRINITY_DN73463_c0_g1_i1:32-1144(-)